MHDTNGKSLKVGDNVYCSRYGFCEITTMDSDGSYMTAQNSSKTIFGHNQAAFSELNAVKVRSWKELAQLALDIQSACNLSGVVHSFSQIITEIRYRLESENTNTGGTDAVNHHPICKVFTDKMMSLSGIPQDCGGGMLQAYVWVQDRVKY